MADKGNTYYCTWKHESDGSRTGWEIRQSKLRATASEPSRLVRELGDIIGEYYDDHEAALHFDPPLSLVGDASWYADELVELTWNAGFHFRPSALTAYSDGRCKRCGCGLGKRTSSALEVDAITESADGASSPVSNEPPPGYGMPGSLKIVSEEFLSHLNDDERQTFEARPVKWSRPNRRHFFELAPRTYVPLGAISGTEVDGWRCDRCGRCDYSNGSMLGWGVQVACRRDLPTDSPKFLFAGSETDVHLYCARARWQSLAGKNWSRKLTGQRLAVVDISQFEDDPVLGTLDEIAEFRRKYGFKIPFKPQSKK